MKYVNDFQTIATNVSIQKDLVSVHKDFQIDKVVCVRNSVVLGKIAIKINITVDSISTPSHIAVHVKKLLDLFQVYPSMDFE